MTAKKYQSCRHCLWEYESFGNIALACYCCTRLVIYQLPFTEIWRFWQLCRGYGNRHGSLRLDWVGSWGK